MRMYIAWLVWQACVAVHSLSARRGVIRAARRQMLLLLLLLHPARRTPRLSRLRTLALAH